VLRAFGITLRYRVGEGLAKLLELIDEGENGGFSAKKLFLLLVQGVSLGEGIFHGDDVVHLLAEGVDALVD